MNLKNLPKVELHLHLDGSIRPQTASELLNINIEEVEKNGYKGMLYGSKNYLEQIWLPNNHNVWLAHYTDKTSYEGNYKFWQLTEIGKVDGIDGTVDIDIYYEK